MTKLDLFKIATFVLLVSCFVLSFILYEVWEDRKRWRDSALGNARKRLRKNEVYEAEKRQINAKAAKEIHRLNIELDALAAENNHLRKINRNYKKQLERREANETITQ